MECGSEQSDDDMSLAKVLTHMGERTQSIPEPKVSKPNQTKEDEKENFSEQSSLADDNDKEMIPEVEPEYTQDFMEIQEPVATYPMPLFTKTSGEVIVQLTSLYSPLPSTQAYYDKCNLIKRVCKSSASQSDYHNYSRSLREYKSQLAKHYADMLSEQDFPGTQDDLMIPTDNYERKLLMKRLRESDCMIQELETYTPSLDSPPALPSKLFYDIKNSDFTTKVVWKGSKSQETKLGFPKTIKGTEVQNPDQTSKPENFLYINYNEKEIPSLKKFPSFEVRDHFNSNFAGYQFSNSFSHKTSKIQFKLQKRQGRPGKFEIVHKAHSISGFWGELLGQKRESETCPSFTVKKQKLLFEEDSSLASVSVPTNIDRLFQEHYWKDLVFDREIYKLKERYGKLVVNPLDPNNMEVKEPEMSVSEDDAEDYSDDDFDRNDEFESKADKSMLSDSSHMMDKNHEMSIKSKVTMLKHACAAYEYPFIKTEWTKQELRSFHRPEIYLGGKKWKLRISKYVPSNPVHESKGENITAHATLVSPKQLSVKEGPFLILEFLEKRPPLLNNFAMAGKIKRYYKGAKRPLEEYPEYIGPLGVADHIDSNKEFPLIGNLQEGSGISVLETNLFRVPIYFHNPRPTDFLLIKYEKQNGKFKWYLRHIEYLYTTGQQEPKLDVMAPNARLTNAFQQKRIQAFIYKSLLEHNNRVDLREISQKFTSINEGAIRKQMKNINCEQQTDGSWICLKLPSEQEIKEMITPEEICQYESMLAGQRRLKDKGIKITSIDKVPNAIQKLKKEMDNKKISFWADFIEEELTVTPWNLTSSYLKTKGEKGMMRITGVGDPTHGMCGFSFVRLPMKLPNTEKAFIKNDPSDYLPTNMTVTGTNADLRTLTKEDVTKALINLGCHKDDLHGLGRWNGVAMLRSLASKMVSEGYKGSVEKYARGIRMSTKMQKEQCQKTIDEIFHRQIRILGEKREFYSDKSTDSDDDTLARQVAENINKPAEDRGKRMDLDEDIERSEKLHLENFKSSTNIFTIPVVNTQKAGVRKILKRVSRMPNLQGTITVKVSYISDPAEIEEYYKRKLEEELPKNKEKTKRTADTLEQRILKIPDAKRKKKRETEGDPKKEEKKLLEEKKFLEKQQELSQSCLNKVGSGEIPSTGAGKIVCGKCGLAGHMKTNRKKCPMFSAESPDSFRAEKEGMVKMEGSKIKLSIEKIQLAAEKKKEEHFYGDYSRPKTISARRRRQVEENPYDDVAFKLIRFDSSRMFINPVKKEAYPDYYHIITHPVDLTSMNAKAKRGEYSSAESFIEDLSQIVENSAMYNGQNHDVTHQAMQIKEEGVRLLREKELLVDIPMIEED